MRKAELLVITFLVAAFFSAQINILPIEVALLADESQSLILADYEVHDPISIRSDDDFETQGWPGNGTAGNPYVIEGLLIETGSEKIYIQDTTVYFVVRDCHISNPEGLQYYPLGIYMYNAPNALIEDNILDRAGVGIHYSPNLRVISNTGYYRSWGISMSDDAVIANNTCRYSNRYGINVGTDNVLLINNTCSYNGLTTTDANCGGIICNGENVTVAYNTCNNNGGDDTSAGIQIGVSTDAIVYNNTCNDNIWAGIQTSGCSMDVVLTSNTCVGNGIGIYTREVLWWQTKPYPYETGSLVYSNKVGWNSINALDDVDMNCQWDDGVSTGNLWGDYDGTSTYYLIPGSANSIDHYPSKADTTSPAIDSPDDFYCEDDSSGNSIAWTVVEDHPTEYLVVRNGTPVTPDIWSGIVHVGVDELGLGVYNFTLTIIDTCANSATDTVFVTVGDTIAPELSSPSDFSYEYGMTGNQISWTVGDANPDEYRIDGNAMVVGWTPWLSGEILINVDGLVVGVFNFTLSVVDTNDNLAIDTVYVAVVDGTPPCIDSPDDLTYNEGDTGSSIVWNPTDLYPASYQILKDAVVISSGIWNSTVETLTITVDGLTLGVYTYTAFVVDIGGNTASDSVLVTVLDGALPTLDHPDDLTYDEGSIGNSITWNAQDKYATGYQILMNGTLIESGSWSSSENISISVDGLDSGTHNFTLVVFDAGGNNVGDTVMVTVVDTTDPSLNTPEDIQFKFGDAGHSLTWMLQDMNPFSYEVFMNSTLIASGSWNSTGETVTIALDGISVGIHSFTIYVTDLAGNEASDMAIVTVFPDSTTTDTTTTSPPADSQFQIMDVFGFGIGFGVLLSVIVFVVLRKRE